MERGAEVCLGGVGEYRSCQQILYCPEPSVRHVNFVWRVLLLNTNDAHFSHSEYQISYATTGTRNSCRGGLVRHDCMWVHALRQGGNDYETLAPSHNRVLENHHTLITPYREMPTSRYTSRPCTQHPLHHGENRARASRRAA
jgi:hypothetical protein